MYYDRKLSEDFEKKLKEISWLIPYIKKSDDLDILIGKSGTQEYCSIYRGTSRIAKIEKNGKKYKVKAADSYCKLCIEQGIDLYGELSDERFNEKNLERLRQLVATNHDYDENYNNHKEGYYQNMIQRSYGILANAESPLLIVDKEVVIGYKNQKEKDEIFGEEQKKYKNCKRNLQKSNPKKFRRPSNKDALGNELDLLALDREGRIHLMELKHGGSTHGIYLSPFQIGLYKRIFDKIDISNIKETLKGMIEQKQRMGLLPKDWIIPDIKDGYILDLIICDCNSNSRACPERFNEVKQYIEEKDSDIYNDVRDIKVKDENFNEIYICE